MTTTNTDQERWREEFEQYIESDKSIYFYDVSESICSAYRCYLAGKRSSQVEIDSIKGLETFKINQSYREEIQSLKEENEKLKHNFNIEDHACATGDCPHEKQSECDETLKSYKYQDQIQSLKQLLSEAEPYLVQRQRDNVLNGREIGHQVDWLRQWRAMK